MIREVKFESQDRRIKQILAALNENGIKDIEEANAICEEYGLDPYLACEETQPICFENAKWAYVVGCAIAMPIAEALNKMGVYEIEALGKPFDPNFHNAVMHVEDESFGENEIVEVFQKGYKKGLRVFKFFPAEQCGGLAAIKLLSGPFKGAKFLPTGGMNYKNIVHMYVE